MLQALFGFALLLFSQPQSGLRLASLIAEVLRQEGSRFVQRQIVIGLSPPGDDRKGFADAGQADPLEQAMAEDGPFLIDFLVEPEENVYPMVAPGASLSETIEAPGIKEAAWQQPSTR